MDTTTSKPGILINDADDNFALSPEFLKEQDAILENMEKLWSNDGESNFIGNPETASNFKAKRLQEIKLARIRITQHTYGYCKLCGQFLGKKRLKASPLADQHAPIPLDKEAFNKHIRGQAVHYASGCPSKKKGV